MVTKPVKERRLSFKKVKGFVTEVRKSAIPNLIDSFKSPFSWSNIFWDSNLADDFEDHVMRITRIMTGIGFALRFVSVGFFGLFLAVDGLHSFFRHRVELHVTRSWRDDVPRVTRTLFGLMLVTSVIRMM